MDKPIPDEIMQEARRLADLSSFPDADAAIAGIAHALLAERERAAGIARTGGTYPVTREAIATAILADGGHHDQ